MIPHMARFLIELISKPGDVILDPFCGSGAVLVESLICNRNAIGVDINPLAVIIAQSKTNIYDPDILNQQRDWLLNEFKVCSEPYNYFYPNANYWFTPVTLKKFGAIKYVLENCTLKFELEYIQFWLSVLASIVRMCSKADTRGPKPFISKRAREKRFGKHFDPFKFFDSVACKRISLERDFNNRIKSNENLCKIRVL